MALPDMAEALRLTRAGNLDGAAAILRGAMPSARAPAAPARPAPPEARTAATGRFTAHNHGGLAYKLYVPASAKPGSPMLVMMHGCTQSPDDFAVGTGMNAAADAHGLVVAYPGQTSSANANKCWNWFRPGDQARGGEPAQVGAMTQALVAEHGCDPSRVFVAGLSAGGAAAAVLGHAYPEVFAGIGVHSGLACGSAHDLPSALAAMRGGAAGKGARAVRVITFHGDRDTTVAKANADAIVSAARSATTARLELTTETGQSPGGRAYTCARFSDTAGRVRIEQWTVAGAGHAWSGGSAAGSYTDPAGPDASAAMLRFFLDPAA